MRNLSVEYNPDDNELEKFSDGAIESYVENLLKGIDKDSYVVLLTGQELMIMYIRLAILQGKIPHNSVEFRYKDNIMFPDKFGRIDWYPDGFCDYTDKLLTKFLDDFMKGDS